LNTAGRAVVFAGITVCVALLGLLTLGISFLGGVGIAAAIIVAISVIAASTLLPALLGVYKMKVLSRKARKKLKNLGPTKESQITGIWQSNANFVQKNSRIVAAVAIIVMAV